jgi:hypothetical protein
MYYITDSAKHTGLLIVDFQNAKPNASDLHPSFMESRNLKDLSMLNADFDAVVNHGTRPLLVKMSRRDSGVFKRTIR